MVPKVIWQDDDSEWRIVYRNHLPVDHPERLVMECRCEDAMGDKCWIAPSETWDEPCRVLMKALVEYLEEKIKE